MKKKYFLFSLFVLFFSCDSQNDYSVVNTSEKIYIVSPNEGDFKSINEAVQIVPPGSVILIEKGVYNESIHAFNKEIHLIGEDRENCIIQNSTGSYETPPIEINKGSLRNLTFYAKEGTSTNERGWTDYSIHNDDNSSYCASLIIDNCNFISEMNYSLGMGVRGGGIICWLETVILSTKEILDVFFSMMVRKVIMLDLHI